jgi:WD40 repeat protein
MAGAGLESRLTSANGPGRASLYDASTGRLVRAIDQPAWVTAAAFSPDGKTLLTGGADGVVRRWDVATGTAAGRDVSAGDSVLSVAYSPDGRTFATGSGNGVTKLWDERTGAFTGRSFVQRGWVRVVQLSPDGALLLTAGTEKAARLWDVKTGEPIGPPLEHRDSVLAATFSPDGRQLVTGSCDQTVRLWPTPALADRSAEQAVLGVQVRTGTELDREGTVRRLDPEAWRERRERLRVLGGAPGL